MEPNWWVLTNQWPIAPVKQPSSCIEMMISVLGHLTAQVSPYNINRNCSPQAMTGAQITVAISPLFPGFTSCNIIYCSCLWLVCCTMYVALVDGVWGQHWMNHNLCSCIHTPVLYADQPGNNGAQIHTTYTVQKHHVYVTTPCIAAFHSL